jgi:phosphonate transport system substrate-binding protein
VSRELETEIKEKLRKYFLNMHLNNEGKAILDKVKIDSFVMVEDSAYNSVREMKKWMDKKQNENSK